jgi:hypothetical protein
MLPKCTWVRADGTRDTLGPPKGYLPDPPPERLQISSLPIPWQPSSTSLR